MKTTMLRPRDVADLLGMPVQSVYLLMASERLPHVRLGRRLFVPVASWDLWLAEQNRIAQRHGGVGAEPEATFGLTTGTTVDKEATDRSAP